MRDVGGDSPRARRECWYRAIEFREWARGYVDLDVWHRGEIIEDARRDAALVAGDYGRS